VIWTVSVSRLSDLFRHITPNTTTWPRSSRCTSASTRPRATSANAWQRTLRRRDRGRLERRLPARTGLGAGGGGQGQRLRRDAGAGAGARLSARIALISYQQPMPELAEFAATFGLAIEQRTYVTEEDARAAIAELKASGIEVIVGAGLITDLAEEAGLKAVFVYSAASIRSAFDDALEMARLTRLEAAASAARTAARIDARARRGLNDLRGESPAMERLRQTVVLYARSPATVLIQGETGSGKELVAQAIHRESPRRAPTGPSSPSTAARSPNRCWNRNCSATRKARSRARAAAATPACSRRPTAAPCSSTRSARCRWPCRPACCACSRSAR
jgi:propionate catabolism operon transcriptional regulator